MEVACGFAAVSGCCTSSPHAGAGIFEGTQDSTFGWCLTPESGLVTDLPFGTWAARRESADTAPGNIIGFEAAMR